MFNNLFLYSSCGSEWLDCLAEDENYLLTRTSFYDECEVVQDSSANSLNAATKNTCLGPRKCQNVEISTDGLPYVGYDPFGNCTCPLEEVALSETYEVDYLYKRQTEERFETISTSSRVLRTRKGGRRKLKDDMRQKRTKRYRSARRIARNIAEIDFELDSDDLLG